MCDVRSLVGHKVAAAEGEGVPLRAETHEERVLALLHEPLLAFDGVNVTVEPSAGVAIA